MISSACHCIPTMPPLSVNFAVGVGVFFVVGPLTLIVARLAKTSGLTGRAMAAFAISLPLLDAMDGYFSRKVAMATFWPIFAVMVITAALTFYLASVFFALALWAGLTTLAILGMMAFAIILQNLPRYMSFLAKNSGLIDAVIVDTRTILTLLCGALAVSAAFVVYADMGIGLGAHMEFASSGVSLIMSGFGWFDDWITDWIMGSGIITLACMTVMAVFSSWQLSGAHFTRSAIGRSRAARQNVFAGSYGLDRAQLMFSLHAAVIYGDISRGRHFNGFAPKHDRTDTLGMAGAGTAAMMLIMLILARPIAQ